MKTMREEGSDSLKDHKSQQIDRKTESSLLRDSQRKTLINTCILVLLGAVSAAMSAYLFFGAQKAYAGGFQLFVAGSFWVLAAYTRHNPYRAHFLALVAYLLLIFVMAISEPDSLIEDLMLKAAVIGVLLRGMKAGREIRSIEKRLVSLQINQA